MTPTEMLVRAAGRLLADRHGRYDLAVPLLSTTLADARPWLKAALDDDEHDADSETADVCFAAYLAVTGGLDPDKVAALAGRAVALAA